MTLAMLAKGVAAQSGQPALSETAISDAFAELAAQRGGSSVGIEADFLRAAGFEFPQFSSRHAGGRDARRTRPDEWVGCRQQQIGAGDVHVVRRGGGPSGELQQVIQMCVGHD